MLVWNNIKTVKDNNLFIRQIKYIGGHSPERGYIYFDNVEDTNDRIPSDGRIDLLYDAVYENKYEVGVYYVCDIINEKNNIYIPSLTNYKIIYYSDVDAVNNYLFLSEDVSSGFDEEGNKITSVTDTTLIEVNYTEIRCREKQQVRPSDESQEWVDTDVVRDKEDCDIIYDDCSCGRTYQWFRVGEICDNGNLCEKLKFQYQDECGYWKDYQPELYKIGDVIEMDSSLCGTYEYKEEWDEENKYCGSYINELYNLDKNSKLNEHNKYIIKYPYIKKYDEFVWQQLDCSTLLGYKVVKENSFECGWYGEKPEIIKNICGSNAKELYPTKLSGLTDTYKYNITLNGYYITAPYPTNTDDMSEDEWVWIENPSGFTSYSTSIVKRNDCDCGYYITSWTDTNEFICGNKLGDGYTPTTLYKKYRKDKYCDGKIIEEGTEYKYESYHSNDCECGYYTTKWDDTEEYICGYLLNEGLPSLTINSVQGNWLREGKTFTSNDINDGQITVERIYFRVGTPTAVTFTIDQSSENGYDYLVISNLDKPIVSGSPTSTGSSYNYYNHKSKTTGSTSMTISDTNEHFVELMYRKDGSQSSGRDNVIVTLGVGGYIDTSYYIKQIENKYCDGSMTGTTGNERWSEYEKNSYGCGYKSYRWYDTGEDICCGSLENSENSCTNYYKYNVEIYQVTEDGKTWKNVIPERYRYGSIVETKSPDCGFIPILTHWKLICPDITYETAVSGDSCTICGTYENAPTMFAIEKQQTSTDGGITYNDDYDSNGNLIIRTEKMLKWKAEKCGYTGDTFAWFIDRESITCDGTNQVGTYYFKVSSDGGNTWTNVEGIEPEVRIIDKTNDNYLSDLDCSNTN